MSDLVEKIVKRDDIRAKTPEPLNEKVALAIGIFLARYFKKQERAKVIVIGYDMRLSSAGLHLALNKGIDSQEVQVESLGLCSTEMISFVSGNRNVPAVMVTASHNPKDYNGFKIFLPGAIPVGYQALREIVEWAEKFLKIEGVSGHQVNMSVDESYVKKVLAVSGISQEGYGKKIPVVIEAGNGMGGRVFQKIAPHIKWLDPIYYYDEPDGNIPSGIMPDTLNPLYLARLAQEVAKEKAVLGICFDGDADRAAFVYRTKKGEVSILNPSQVGGLIIKKILKGKAKKSKVLYTLVCSVLIPELVKELGGITVMTPVGYGQVRERMLKPENSDCSFALEHSGHYFYRDFYCADSGMITALIVLDIVARLTSEAENLDSVISSWKARFFQSDEINFEFPDSKQMQETIERVRQGIEREKRLSLVQEYAPGDPIDNRTILKYQGSLINCPGWWWFCLRSSQNEPTKLRLIAEIILDKEIPENQRLELGPEIRGQEMNHLVINLIGRLL